MGDIEMTGGVSALLMLVIAILVIGIILFMRNLFKSRGNANLAEKYDGHKWASPLDARNKYPDVNAFKYGSPIFLFGLTAALAATLFAFSWTTYDEAVIIPDGALDMEEEIEIEPPRTAEPPPPPPPPPPPIIEEVPEEEIEEEEEPVFEDMDVEEEDVVEAEHVV